MSTHKGLTCYDREIILGGMEPGNDKLAEAQTFFTFSFINIEYIIKYLFFWSSCLMFLFYIYYYYFIIVIAIVAIGEK